MTLLQEQMYLYEEEEEKIKKKKGAQNSGTTILWKKPTFGYLESSRICVYSLILKMGKNMTLILFEEPH